MIERIETWDPASSPAFWINHVSRLLMRDLEAALRPLGLGMAYLPVAMLLEEDGPLQQKQLVSSIGVEQPTMAALLVRMERDGVVTKTPHPTDRRASQFALSDTARQRLPVATKLVNDVVDKALSGIDHDDRSVMLSCLRQMAGNLGEGRAEPGTPPLVTK